MTGLYVLKDKIPIPCDDLILWLQNQKDDNWVVGRNYFQDFPDKFLISTIFFGLPSGFKNGEPLLFETKIFKKRDAPYLFFGATVDWVSTWWKRHTTWEEANLWHKNQCGIYGYFHDPMN